MPRCSTPLTGIVWEADPATFCFTFVSIQAEHILGYPVHQWLNNPAFWPDHIHPEDRERAVAYCVEQTKLGLPHDFEYRMLAADGRTVWIRDIVSVFIEEGAPVMAPWHHGRHHRAETSASRHSFNSSVPWITAWRVLPF